MNKKMNSQLTILCTDEGKLLIERQKIDDHVHKHFKDKFQTKQKELDEINQTEEYEDQIHAISKRNKKTISNEPTETETKKAIEKLKVTSSPGPDGVTSKLAKLLYKRLPKIFNHMHI